MARKRRKKGSSKNCTSKTTGKRVSCARQRAGRKAARKNFGRRGRRRK